MAKEEDSRNVTRMRIEVLQGLLESMAAVIFRFSGFQDDSWRRIRGGFVEDFS